MKNSLPVLALLSAFALAGCGSGGDRGGQDSGSRVEKSQAFIDWGAPGGEVVRDFNLVEYRFTAANAVAPSCLYDVKGGVVVANFCHAAGQAGDRYLFVDRYVDIRRASLPDGRCAAAMVDVGTASIVYVYVRDGAVTLVTGVTPAAPC